MDKRLLQSYAVWAKDNLEQQIEVSLKTLGINGDNDFRHAKRSGEYTIIDGDPNSYPAELYTRRQVIINQIRRNGYKTIIEEYAYTWFNRLVALRFMELHDFLPHGFRVLSSTSGSVEPDILKNLSLVGGELRLDMKLCEQLKNQNKTEELFRHVLICQCNALSDILPMLFSLDMAYMELLLPKSLLIGETVLTRLIEIPEENFMHDVEIIGWMYQFYISAKKDAVMSAKKTITRDTLPAVTQLFTPDWIVRYMAENSVGRIWMESYPRSTLRNSMCYYVDDPEQTEEVQRKLDKVKYKNVNPETIRVIEPCSGSGHILVYVMELLFKMYEEKGYNKRDIPTLILKNNLVGLDVDKRAAQLASFALVMKARTLNNRFFRQEYYVLPQVYELQDSREMESLNYRKHMKELENFSDSEIRAVSELVTTFENGKTIGSLIKVPALDYAAIKNVIYKLEHVVVPTIFNAYFVSGCSVQLKILLNQAKVLSTKYDVMITNPPYRGVSTMEDSVKKYASHHYPDSKTDLFSMFIDRSSEFTKQNGYSAFLTPYVWMFIQSYEKVRYTVCKKESISSLIQFEYSAFEEATVPICSFVLRNTNVMKIGSYIRLTNFKGGMDIQKDRFLDAVADKRCGFFYETNSEIFEIIPGAPIVYWLSMTMFSNFTKGDTLGKIAYPRQGLATADNNRFLRLWFEVCVSSIALEKGADFSSKKWFLLNKGGAYRKWYGNQEYVINWANNGSELRAFKRAVIRNPELYFKEGISHSDVSSAVFSIRYYDDRFIFDHVGPTLFFSDHEDMMSCMGFLNSKVTMCYLQALCPTIHFSQSDVAKLPILKQQWKDDVNNLVVSSIKLSKADWDSFEISWDFQHHPLCRPHERTDAKCTQFAKSRIETLGSLAWQYECWVEECQDRFNALKANEEELNSIFIEIYGLQDELMPEVEDKDVSVRLADRVRDVKSLISYLIGLVMGRYSLDVPGLAYAGGVWDPTKYQTYQPDDDGIIPIYRDIGMEDGLTAQLIGLLKLIYGEDTYRQNIDFIAESIGRNSNESSEEALNRYLNDGFYADHLKIYQKRPIYWLFSSGKNSGFKCLVYMHRYASDTLARINSRYFLPESTRLKNELEELAGRLAKAEGRNRVRLEKERQKLAAAYNEAIEYGQVLDHMANQYIEIDLDDGVKTNYAKFQSVEMVTDSGNKVKNDLLAPIK